MQLTTDSLKDLNIGDRVTLTGVGVPGETFQVARIGRAVFFISLRYGYEYTRPQLVEKYMQAGCTFEVSPIPERGWE